MCHVSQEVFKIAPISMGEILNTSCHACNSYIVLFLCNKKCYIVFSIIALLYFCVSLLRKRVLGTHNAHVWSVDNPYRTRALAVQQRFSVNVRAGIVVDSLVEPHNLLPRLEGCFLDTYFLDWTSADTHLILVLSGSLIGFNFI